MTFSYVPSLLRFCIELEGLELRSWEESTGFFSEVATQLSSNLDITSRVASGVFFGVGTGLQSKLHSHGNKAADNSPAVQLRKTANNFGCPCRTAGFVQVRHCSKQTRRILPVQPQVQLMPERIKFSLL